CSCSMPASPSPSRRWSRRCSRPSGVRSASALGLLCDEFAIGSRTLLVVDESGRVAAPVLLAPGLLRLALACLDAPRRDREHVRLAGRERRLPAIRRGHAVLGIDLVGELVEPAVTARLSPGGAVRRGRP